jgi:hypothetical protein
VFTSGFVVRRVAVGPSGKFFPKAQSMSISTQRIRVLNDRLRTTGNGGRVVITSGIGALPEGVLRAVLIAVQTFDDFTADNDPHGEHDFALIEVADQRVMFKIDYYHSSLTYHSPDPSDPTATTRVLTIMLASEY